MKIGDLVTAYNSSLRGLVLELLEDDYWGQTARVHVFKWRNGPKTKWSRIVELECSDLELISESR